MLKDYINQNINIAEKELFKWLLRQLVFKFEPSIYEVSGLLNDSFSRFRKKYKDQYYQLCEKVTKYINSNVMNLYH